ncbi:MAG: ATP-binding protein [Elusimicrobiota bacterium]|jgi:hypothetical protein|nr:ATP-binding protein [Elusimicrobiota bacterium]
MNRKARLIFLGLSLIFLIGVGYYVSKNFDFLLNDFWFTSGFLLLILLSLIDQPFFSKDSNVFVNAITAGISLLLVNPEYRSCLFWIFGGITLYLAISSYVLMWIRSKSLPNENKLTQFISKINREIGKPQTLFSAFFLWGAINKFGVNSYAFNALMLYWAIFMILRIDAIAMIISSLFDKKENIEQESALGKIFGVQSKNTFLVKLFPERKETTKIFDFVEFLYSIDEKQTVRKGLILDTYLLNEQQWVKVLTTNEITRIFEKGNCFENHTADVVYKVKEVPDTKYLNTFIGIVTENSTIEKIKFIYNSKNEITESNLLEVKIGNRTVYYQIIEGMTIIEQLENKNETGFIIGEAIQLGIWEHDKVKFEPFGWVPEINSPVYIASHIENTTIGTDELEIGKIPNTNFPVVIKKDLALTHHTAVIGVTGTGKSVFSRNLIREYLKDEKVKVICVDFTGEYKDKFKDLTPVDIINDTMEKELFKKIDEVEAMLIASYGKENNKTKTKRQEISKKMIEQISVFLKDNNSKISIIDLPEIVNTSANFEYMRLFIKSIFYIAKKEKSFGNKVCLVLEEAHTIIPEWKFSGISEKSAQPLLNSIAQIALQGRKYNVGLLVIAQRTANVSKTILTQCNTVVAFQQFDKTSSEFLANYFGDGIAKILPTLKFRQAVVAGKALKSNIPMIFEVPEIAEQQERTEREYL